MNLGDIVLGLFDKLSSFLSNFNVKLAASIPFMLFFEVQHLVYAFLILVFIDTLLGVVYSIKNGTFSSRRFREVIYKLFLYFCLLIAARTFEYLIQGYTSTTVITETIIIIISLTELASIIEKSVLLGAPLPQKDKLFVILKLLKYDKFAALLSLRSKQDEFKRDFDKLSIADIKYLYSDDLRTLFKIHFEEWKKLMFKELQTINFSKRKQTIDIEISILFKKVKSDIDKQLTLKLQNYSVQKTYNSFYKKELKSTLEEIHFVLDNEKLNEKRRLKIIRILLNFNLRLFNKFL